MNDSFTIISKLFVGSTVTNIEKPDKGVYEAIAKFTIKTQDGDYEFHLHATDLGYWVSGIKTLSNIKTLSKKVITFDSLTDAWENMIDHVIEQTRYAYLGDQVLFEPVEDVLKRLLGFKCLWTDKTWWFKMSTIKESNHPCRILMQTSDGRDELANYLSMGQWMASTPDRLRKIVYDLE